MRQNNPTYLQTIKPAIELLRSFGYRIDNAGDELPSNERAPSRYLDNETLRQKMAELNQGAADDAIERACQALQQPQGASLIAMNQEIHHRLVTGWQDARIQNSSESLRYLDFDSPFNNDFALVAPFAINTLSGRFEFDAVILVNGIPLVIITATTPDPAASSRAAIQEFLELQQDPNAIPFFANIHLMLFINRSTALYGTVTTPAGEFAKWNAPFPFTLDQLYHRLQKLAYRVADFPSAQDIAVAALLQPEWLLDHLRHFTAFEKQPGRTIKRLGQLHHRKAVSEAFSRIAESAKSEESGRRGMVIWQANGAERELSLIWFVLKLHTSLRPPLPAIFVLSEKHELRDRLQNLLQHHNLDPLVELSDSDLRKAKTRLQRPVFIDTKELRQLATASQTALDSGNEESLAAVVIDHPFRSDFPELAEIVTRLFGRDRVLAFSPLPVTKQELQLMTGAAEYLDTYRPEQAVDAGQAVAVKYETRLPDSQVLNQQSKADWLPAPEPQTSREAARRMAATGRVQSIAQDIALHFSTECQPGRFKAVILAIDAATAVAYYRALENLLDRSAEILIDPQRIEASELKTLIETPLAREQILQQFAPAGTARAQILITAATLPSDLRFPPVHIVYVDRPLAGYELLETIFLPATVMAKKQYGLIVDYFGAFNFWQDLLQDFKGEDIENLLTFRFAESEFEILRRRRRDLFSLFPTYLQRDLTERWVLQLEPPEIRQTFCEAWQSFIAIVDQLLPDSRALDMLDEVLWLDAVRADAATFYFDKALRAAALPPKIEEYRGTVRSISIERLSDRPDFSLSNFEREIERLHSDEARITYVEYAIKKEINAHMASDPAFFRGVQARLQSIRRQWRHQELGDAAALEAVCAEAGVVKQRLESIKAGQGTAAASSAFLGIIEEFLTVSEADRTARRERHEVLAKELIELIEAEVAIVDWQQKSDVQREMRRKFKHRLRTADCPKNIIEPLTNALVAVCRAQFD